MNSVHQIQLNGLLYPLAPQPVMRFQYMEAIKFIAFNIFTLGLHGVALYYQYESRLRELEWRKKKLESNGYELLHRWDELEEEMNDGTGSFVSMRREVEQLRLYRIDLHGRFSTAFTMSLLFKRIVEGFCNYITLGIYTAYKVQALKTKIDFIEDEQIPALERILTEKLKEEKATEVSRRLDLLAEQLTRKVECRQIQATVPAVAELQRIEELNRVQMIDRQQAEQRISQTGLRTRLQTIETANQGLRERLSQAETVQRTNEEVLSELNTNISTYEGSIVREMREKERFELRERESRDLINNRGVLQGQLDRLEATQRKIRVIQNLHSSLGIKPSKYQKQPNDGPVFSEMPGIFPDDDEARGIIPTQEQQAYADEINAQTTAEGIVKTCYKAVKAELDKRPYRLLVRFNYAFVAIRLIEGARLKLDDVDCRGAYLYLTLNQKDVRIHSSKPALVQSNDAEGNPITKTHFSYRDDFTHLSSEEGIDPVAIKWMWNKLSPRKRDIIKEEIIDAYRDYMEEGDFYPQDTLNQLIMDLGDALYNKFGSH